MTTLTRQIRQGAEQAWATLSEGWRDLRHRASGSLTRFRRSDRADTDGPASAFGLPGAMEWALVSADVELDGDDVVVRLEVPGMRREDLHVDIGRDRVSVWGEKRVDSEARKDGYRVSECAYGHFQRELALPQPVDPAKANATYRDGVLRIRVPRVGAGRGRRVTVQDA